MATGSLLAAGGASGISGTTLTIYSSLPRQGPSGPQARAIENGAKMALAERGGKVGRYKIVYRPLDDSRSTTGAADEARAQANARRAAADETAIAYVGEYNSSISKSTIPILNRAGIAQVSPSNTFNGLTVSGPGTDPGDPHKYYPTGRRTYARILPNDVVQAAALATVAKDDGCRSVHVFHSGTTYSRGLAVSIGRSARSLGLKVSATVRYDPRAPDYRRQARKVRAPCVIETGEIESNGLRVVLDVGRARPKARIYAADGMCLDDTARHLSRARRKRFRCTIAVLDRYAYPPGGRRVLADYAVRYDDDTPDPYAITGYESMALLLDSIQRASESGGGGGGPGYGSPFRLSAAANGDVTREGVVAALFATKDRNSVLGTYSIDANGDTTLRTYGLYKVDGRRRLTYDRTIHAR
ncbi:MAG TPA: branched-chain amino acid ABC transporter substrate-binding protein [Thermoleophilaceae bacterium]